MKNVNESNQKQPTSKLKKGCLYLVLGFVALLILVGIFGDEDKKQASINQPKIESPESPSNKSEKPAKENWQYQENEDKMSGEKRYFASTTSTNTVDFEFPYNGGSSFYLSVRNINNRNDILVKVSKGQFLGGLNPKVRVKFDDEKPTYFNFSEPADASADIIFINNTKKFISKLKQAEKLMIETQFFNEGNRIMEFDVKGLKWEH